MIQNVPSAPFSMNWIAPMGEMNPQLSDALKRLSATKYGKPRAVVEKDIFDRLGKADADKKARLESMRSAQQAPGGVGTGPAAGGKSSFLDEWLAKRQQLGGTQQTPVQPPQQMPPATASAPLQPNSSALAASEVVAGAVTENGSAATNTTSTTAPERLDLRGDAASAARQDEISIRLK